MKRILELVVSGFILISISACGNSEPKHSQWLDGLSRFDPDNSVFRQVFTPEGLGAMYAGMRCLLFNKQEAFLTSLEVPQNEIEDSVMWHYWNDVAEQLSVSRQDLRQMCSAMENNQSQLAAMLAARGSENVSDITALIQFHGLCLPLKHQIERAGPGGNHSEGNKQASMAEYLTIMLFLLDQRAELFGSHIDFPEAEFTSREAVKKLKDSEMTTEEADRTVLTLIASGRDIPVFCGSVVKHYERLFQSGVSN